MALLFGIPGFNQAVHLNEAAANEAHQELLRVASIGVSSQDEILQRIEGVTRVLGNLTSIMTQVAPSVNLNAANATAIATCLPTIEEASQGIRADTGGKGFGKGAGGYIKGASEHKAIQSIRPLTSDKKEFKLWNSKFINALSQVYPGIRELFEEIDTTQSGGVRHIYKS